MTDKDFIPYEQALELKELGFDVPCFAYWNIDPYLPKPTLNLVKPFDHEWCISAPLYQQAFRWFREKHGLNSHIHQEDRNNYSYCCGKGYSDEIGGYQDFETYEEAELACLEKLIEIVKENEI